MPGKRTHREKGRKPNQVQCQAKFQPMGAEGCSPVTVTPQCPCRKQGCQACSVPAPPGSLVKAALRGAQTLRLFQKSGHLGKTAPVAPRQSSKKESGACSDGKESACNAGDPSSMSGLGRCPGGGNGNLLQYSCLEDSMDRGAWWLLGWHRAGHD